LQNQKFIPGNKLLVLGSALGHDAKFAAEKGFEVIGIDFSQIAIERSRKFVEGMENSPKFIRQDLFNLRRDFFNFKFDLIYEYTTICSFNEIRINEFLEKIDSVLDEGGVFVSVLFPLIYYGQNPPFPINLIKFHEQAKKYWHLKYFQKNIPSVKPRKNNEVLLVYIKDK
jgi:cyclopropane fatty-acyl-phospholipid synthase-like methyltransferase